MFVTIFCRVLTLYSNFYFLLLCGSIDRDVVLDNGMAEEVGEAEWLFLSDGKRRPWKS